MRLKRILNYSSQRRVASVFLCFVLVTSLVIGAFIAPIPVYAWSVTGLNTTIASLILSLVLSTGAAPVNDAWLTSLNNAYGVTSTIGTIGDAIDSGLLIESSGALIDNGLAAAIEAETAYTELGLAELFTTTASDAAEYGVIAASGATNLATTAIEVGTLGTIGAFAGATLAGVGVGILINKAYNYFSNFVKYGASLSNKEVMNIVSDIPEGYNDVYFLLRRYSNSVEYLGVYYYVNDVNCSGYYLANRSLRTKLYGYEDNVSNVLVRSYKNSTLIDEITGNGLSPSMSYSNGLNVLLDTNVYPIFENEEEMNEYINNYNNGDNLGSKKVNNDIITPLGNTYIIGNDGTDSLAGVDGTIPDGYRMYPVDVNDYLNFADNANQNTDNGDTGEDTNGRLYNDLVNPLYVPDNQQPDQPIVPSNPSQPALPNQPDLPVKPEPSAEEIAESLNLATTPTLKEVFPFCIPWDIVDAFTAFKVTNRQAPHIIYEFGNGYVIDVDLSRFDTVAELLRYLELIAFIVGLAMASRALIGAS